MHGMPIQNLLFRPVSCLAQDTELENFVLRSHVRHLYNGIALLCDAQHYFYWAFKPFW